MAQVVITFKIMPESPDVDLTALQSKAESIISKAGEVGKVEIEPIAFGLKALKIFAIMDESKGSPDNIENELSSLENVSRAEVIDVRRTVDV
ncbi:MAG: elongation factor 1-beta [Nanoarchaeota archaeon]|nr:elongation factor 1-beta [Nanoarchaeota archaeon]